MLTTRIVIITAIIIIVQVLGLCVAAPIDPLQGKSLGSWKETASRFEKNEGAALLMRRSPCFGNLCGKKDGERSQSPPRLSSPGRKEHGDTFMDKVRGVIKDVWKSAGNVAGKAWGSAATGSSKAKGKNEVNRSGERIPEKRPSKINGDENSGGKYKPKKDRSKFSKLVEKVKTGLSPPPNTPLPLPKFTASDYGSYELSGETSQASLAPTIPLDDPRVPLNPIGEVPDTRPPSGQTSGGLRLEASGPESGKQSIGSKDQTFATPHMSSFDSALKPKLDKDRKATPPLSSSPNPALESKLEKGKGRSQAPDNDKEEPPTRESMFRPQQPADAGPSEPLNGHTSASAPIPAPPTVIGPSQTDGEHLSEAAGIPALPGPSEPREPSGPAGIDTRLAVAAVSSEPIRIPPPPGVSRPSEPRGRRRPAPVAAAPLRLPAPVVPLRPFTAPFNSVPASGISLQAIAEPKKPAPRLTEEQSLHQTYDENVSLGTMSPPSDPPIGDVATAPVPAERLSVPRTRAQGSAAVSGDDSSRPVRAGASDSARNRSPGPRPARANAAAPKPDRAPVPASVKVSPYQVVDGKPRPRYWMHGALSPQNPSPPTDPGPSRWYERLLPKSGNTPSRPKAPLPPAIKKDKERAPPSQSSSEYRYFPPSGPGTPLSIDSTEEPWINVWENSAFNTPKGTLRSTDLPMTDGAASGKSSSDVSEASFYTAPSGHVKRGILARGAEKMVTASPFGDAMIVTYSICVVFIILTCCLGLAKFFCLRGGKPVPRRSAVEDQEEEDQEGSTRMV